MNELIQSISTSMDIPFYSAGVAQDGAVDNYIVWQIISDMPYSTTDHYSDLSKMRVQFDIYSRGERRVFEIGNELEKMMQTKGLVLLRNGPFFNVETKLFRRTIDMSILFKRNGSYE